jgi:PAS domain S-box-containing protein
MRPESSFPLGESFVSNCEKYRAPSGILIVDDENAAATELACALTRLDYVVTGVADSVEGAVRMAEESRPCLVLVDIDLAGGTDGVETAESIHSRFDIPVVYLTDRPADDIINRAKRTKPYGCLSKPVSLAELRKTVETALCKHRADRRVKENKDRFNAVMEAARLGWWDCDVRSGRAYYSPVFCSMLGYEPDTLPARALVWLDWVHHEDRERVKRQYMDCVDNSHDSFEAEYRMRTASGQWRWVLGRFKVVERAGSGQAARIIGTHTDIDDRRQIDKTLLFLLECGSHSSGEDFFQSLARFLAEALNAHFVCIDRLEGDCLSARTLAVFCDGRFEDNMAYTLKDTPCAEVVGKAICSFPRGVRSLFPKDEVLQVLAAESYIGTTLWSSAGLPIGLIAIVNREPLEDHKLAEAVLKLVAVRAADELERRLAREALRYSEERFHQLAENIGEVFWLTYPGQPRRVAYLSSAHDGVWGVKRDEVYGSPGAWLNSVHPEDRESVLAAYDNFLRAKKDYDVEYRVVRPDGTLRWVRDRAFVIRDGEGRIHRVAGVARDITERKADQLRQDELMEEIKHFAHIVSHDLRAPLTNIRGFVNEIEIGFEGIREEFELLLEDMPEDRRSQSRFFFDEDLPEALAFIKSSISRMDKLISAVLKLSRLGRSDLTLELLNMNEVVAEILSSLAHQIADKGIFIRVDQLPRIVSDRTSVEQILGNLVDNAIKYLDPNRPGEIRITGTTQGSEHVFRIEDNGVGVRHNDLKRIFDLFQRSGRENVMGEGMGLTYVRTLVRRHGGRIWCESEPGVGSAFTFTISGSLGPVAEVL